MSPRAKLACFWEHKKKLNLKTNYQLKPIKGASRYRLIISCWLAIFTSKCIKTSQQFLPSSLRPQGLIFNEQELVQ